MALTFYTPSISSYFTFSPVFNVDKLDKWHTDTAFNISLIQSILNWGYPSVSLDGHPLTAYHVFSHYIDAFLYFVSKLPVYESYGFVSLVKVTFFINAIYLSFSSFRLKGWHFLFVFLVCSALIIASWHIILSHALWAPSFLLILVAPNVSKFLFSNNVGEGKDFLVFFLCFILLCLGKISLGLAFALFVFSIRIFNDFKNKWYYIVGFSCFIFFIGYSSFINYSYGDKQVVNFILDFNLFSGMKYVTVFFSFLLVLMLINYFCSYNLNKVVFSFIFSYFSLLLLTMFVKSLSWSDRHYFYHGIYTVSIIFVIFFVYGKLIFDAKKIVMVTTCFSLISFFVYQPVYSISQISLGNILNQFYYLKNDKVKELGLYLEGSAYTLNKYIDDLLKSNNYSRGRLALFLPKDILEKQVIKSKGKKNFYTMNLYAITGVQLVKGVVGLQRAYGFANYNSSSFVTNDLDYLYECKRLNLQAIIKVVDYEKKIYNLIHCTI
ncbi:MAG: hypothetical protein SPE33_04190 [[Pasteurella] aerogenes]|nr:hypothetical protein [[Pasteurella] aerogenes]